MLIEIDLTEEESAKLREAVRRHWDKGPLSEGWQSDLMIAVSEKVVSAIDMENEFERLKQGEVSADKTMAMIEERRKMHLITVTKWTTPNIKKAPKHLAFDTIQDTVAYATALPLDQALERLVEYRERTSEGAMVISFRLLGVTEMPSVSGQVLEELGVELIENLEQE